MNPVRIPNMIQVYSVQSVTLRPIPLTSCLLLLTHLRLGHPSGYFHSGIPNKTLYAFISPHTCYMSPIPVLTVCLFSVPNNIWQAKPAITLPFILSSLLLVPPLSPKYHLQGSILQYSQPTFFS